VQLTAQHLVGRRGSGARRPLRLDAPDDASEVVERLPRHRDLVRP
jgi:hypothetical protein